ncbi:SDR family NAD(P)-dependent oxidoreductase [Chelativorans sp.]|uniref:SDR family NAD(P)-dependent oxidoreductase n=1 Tax=Chelativorans sp. TaxID=2203393 RepID=UPI002811A17A|nr:SDR family NAD(P)-dependent oxidoreductase [Chelativorans sp.]
MSAGRFSLAGRKALVTGANSGIGRTIALALADSGADIVLHHFNDRDGAVAVCAAIEGMGRAAAIVEADFTTKGEAEALARAIVERHGPIDILIANAAIERRGSWKEIDVAHIEAHLAANFTSLLLLAQALVPEMSARGWGRVVAIGSVLARRPRAETVVYAALKSAQLTAVRALAREVAGTGVTMNVVSPGAIETERNAHLYADASFRRAVEAKIPVGRAGRPGDCVGPVLLLCSDAGGYITGADIPVDGGWSIGDAPTTAETKREDIL